MASTSAPSLRDTWHVLIIVSMLIAVASYPFVLVWTFQPFGIPVHSRTHGWLGPTPRDDNGCAMDIGKVNDWECADISVFEHHQRFCKWWLDINGLRGESEAEASVQPAGSAISFSAPPKA